MEIGDALILMGFINLVGVIIIFQLRDRTWFKKEVFKHDLAQTKKEASLRFKKLERELGIAKTDNKSLIPPSQLSNIIGELAQTYLGEGVAEGGEEGGLVEKIMEYVPPELIDNVVKAYLEKKGDSDQFSGQA